MIKDCFEVAFWLSLWVDCQVDQHGQVSVQHESAISILGFWFGKVCTIPLILWFVLCAKVLRFEIRLRNTLQ